MKGVVFFVITYSLTLVVTVGFQKCCRMIQIVITNTSTDIVPFMVITGPYITTATNLRVLAFVQNLASVAISSSVSIDF